MANHPRLLIVDDMPRSLEAYAPEFEECGFDVVSAHYDPSGTGTPKAGVFHSTADIARFAQLTKPPIDAVLTDIDCHDDEFGVRLADELLKGKFNRPIFTFSQAPGEYLEDRLHDMGVKALFRKPHSFNEIQAIAEQIHAGIAQYRAMPPHKS